MPPENDKRRDKRIAHASPVTVKIQSCPGHHVLEGVTFAGTTSDISENGIRLHTNQTLPLHTLLEAEITFAEHRFLFAGRVIWAQMTDATHAHMGVMFTTADESQMWSWKFQMARVFQSGK